MDINTFERLEGLRFETAQPFVSGKRRADALLRVFQRAEVMNKLVGKIVPVYDARDRIKLTDPDCTDKIIGFAVVRNNLHLLVKLIKFDFMKELEALEGKKIDEIVEIQPSGRVVAEKHAPEYLFDYVTLRVLVRQEGLTEIVKKVWVESFEARIEMKGEEMLMSSVERLQKGMEKYLGTGAIKVQMRKGAILLERVIDGAA